MTHPGGRAGGIRFGHGSRASTRPRPFGPRPFGPRPFGWGGSLAGVAILALVAGGALWSAVSARPVSAARPRLFGGDLVLADYRPLAVLDVASAQITVRLEGVYSDVGASSYDQVQPVAVSGGTVLVNRVTGNFNFLDADDYVADPDTAGVGLGALDSTEAEGLASGADAYVIRSGPRSTVSLVGRATAAEASSSAAVTPLGFASVDATVAIRPGSAVVSGSDLWMLESAGGTCRVVEEAPDATAAAGLATVGRGRVAGACAGTALESAAGLVGVAGSGEVRLVPSGSGADRDEARQVQIPALSGATSILPVTGSGTVPGTGSGTVPGTGSGTELWFLADHPDGWELVGVDANGHTAGPFPLSGFSSSSQPVVPVMSGGLLYTLDQSQMGRPTLWTIDPEGGRMAPVEGMPTYPVLSSTELDSFEGAEVVADGPRVIFNNPDSHEAVVVFTDGSHAPVAVDKSSAISVSTTGPADVDATVTGASGKGHSRVTARTTPSVSVQQTSPVVPVVQPVNPQIACADSSQKPYEPQITSDTPSPNTVLVKWSYQLLDQTDCEPDSWSVRVQALDGGRQPAEQVHDVTGQDQYLFEGLYPDTTYEVTVTAYINAQSTASLPVTFTTVAVGPGAPASVTTTADGAGDWIVSWTPCTDTADPDCLVQAATWTVVGSSCGTSGYVGTPPTVQVGGGADSVKVDAASLGLLGDDLTFSVQGSTASGLVGDPTGDGSCTQAWRPPDASQITLTGSGSQDGQSITATLQVETPASAQYPFGVPAGDADFVYSVDGQEVGPTTSTSVTVTGLPAGILMTPSVVVYPAGHPDAAVTVTGAPFSQTLAWPTDLASVPATAGIAETTGTAADPNTGAIDVTFPADLPGGPISETGATVVCGSTSLSEPAAAVTAGTVTFNDIDLVDVGGSCSITMALQDGASPDPYGGPSPELTWDFTFDVSPPQYSFTYQYSAQCLKDFVCGPGGTAWQIQVDSTGPAPQAGGEWAGGNWEVVACDPSASAGCPADAAGGGAGGVGGQCSAVSPIGAPVSFPQDVTLPAGCTDPSGDGFYVLYTYLGVQQVVRVEPAATGSSPGSAATTTTSTTTGTSTTTSTSTTSTTTTTTPTSSVAPSPTSTPPGGSTPSSP